MSANNSGNDNIQATIATAIQSARYNEAVVVTVNDSDVSPSEIVLVACLDPENGGIVWKNCAAGGIDDATPTPSDQVAISKSNNDKATGSFKEDPGIVRHLRTKKWALPMLNDHRRNHLYNFAVREACQQMVNRRSSEENIPVSSTDGSGNEADETAIRILDIGSGTGLLAMMTARHTLDAIKKQEAPSSQQGSKVKNVQVTSVEMASAMARLARMTIDENDMSENIVVVEQHSTDMDFGIDDARFVGEAALKSSLKDTSDAVKNGIGEGRRCFQKADICTSELLESGLLGEGVLPSIRDAWERHLKPDAIVVPRRARVFAVLVEGMPIKSNDGQVDSQSEETTINAATAFLGPELRAFHEASGGVWMSTTSQPLSTNETDIGSIPDQINNAGTLLGSHCSGNAKEGDGAGGIIVPLHADAMLGKNYRDKSANFTDVEGVDDFRGLRPLTDPALVLDFDFASGLDAIPPPTGRSITTTVAPTADGTCHGVLFWWELDLWDGDKNSCTYSTQPIEFSKQKVDAKGDTTNNGSSSLWQDHWQQCLFVFGDGHSSDGGPMTLTKASPVGIITSHDDSSISFSIETNHSQARTVGNDDANHEDSDSRPVQRRRLNKHNEAGQPIQQAMSNRHITAARALQLNDLSRIRTLRSSIQYCLNVKGQDAPLLDISDFGLCAMIASVSAGARKVTSLESSSGALPMLAATVAQIGNNLPRPGSEFQIIQALAEHISEEHIVGRVAEIVVGEPYYEMLEGWHLQEALNYFYLMWSLKKRGVISKSAISVPAYARVMACIIECDDFYSAYGHVGDQSKEGSVAGFQHTSVNYYGDRYHTYSASFPLRQYRHKKLSKVFCVAKISYEGATPAIENIDDSVDLISEGFAQALVIWVDYACRTGDCFDIISTASSSHRQLVRKLPNQIAITEEDLNSGSKFCCHASFDDDHQEIEDHSITVEFVRRRDEKK